nr:hypothetical protein [Tanacetum cinerariifolium]
MFERPDGQAQVWKNQRTAYGQAKVKSCKLLESCGVHIITFTTTRQILLVERRYPLSKFTLDQLLNAVRLKVEEQSELSLELLSFGVDAAMDLEEKHQVFNAAGPHNFKTPETLTEEMMIEWMAKHMEANKRMKDQVVELENQISQGLRDHQAIIVNLERQFSYLEKIQPTESLPRTTNTKPRHELGEAVF